MVDATEAIHMQNRTLVVKFRALKSSQQYTVMP